MVYFLGSCTAADTLTQIEIQTRLSEIRKVKQRAPFESTRVKLESARLKVSRNDIRFSWLAPGENLEVLEPRQILTDTNLRDGLNQFFWATKHDLANTRTVFSEFDTPDEILRVHHILSRATNSVSVAVERRRKVPETRVGNRVLSSTVEWYRSFREPRMANVVVVDDCNNESIHVLVKQYMFLYILRGTGIAASPIFLSPPRSLGMRNGCMRTRRFLAVKQYGVCLEDFLKSYPVRPIPFLETLQIGRRMMKVLYKLHSQGIAHGSISSDAFVFVSGTNIKKGFRLTNFSNSVANERGLSMLALGDLRMLFSALTDMNPSLLSIVTRQSDKTQIPTSIKENLVCIYRQMWTHLFVRDVDYAQIFDCFDSCISALSNNF